MKKRVTIKDVAQKAEVSTATVSRVINGYKWIKPEIRDRVLSVINELHFTPNFSASTMASGKSKMIVIMIATIMNPFFSEFTSVTIRELKRAGYFVLVFETDNDINEEISFLNSPIAGLVEGVISVTDGLGNDMLYEYMQPFKKLQKPVLFVDRDLPTDIADSVINDNINGISSAVESMLAVGHKRIGMILGHQGVSVVEDKIKGYTAALERAGIEMNPDYIFRGKWNVDTGIAGTEFLLSLPEPPTAIIACNNYICNGVLSALETRGLKTGEDISLIGTEECEEDARVFSKQNISTLKLDSAAMAKYASRHILDRLASRDEPRETFSKTIFNMKFTDRGSVQPPKQP